jgi:hypothetical protein
MYIVFNTRAVILTLLEKLENCEAEKNAKVISKKQLQKGGFPFLSPIASMFTNIGNKATFFF